MCDMCTNIPNKQPMTDGQTDRQTDGQTDGEWMDGTSLV